MKDKLEEEALERKAQGISSLQQDAEAKAQTGTPKMCFT